MTVRFPELEQVRLATTSEVRDRHLEAVSSALSERARGSRGRGRLLAVAVAAVLLLPVAALAAEDTVPGDILYPLKRAIEPVVQVFDSSAPAERRVREVEVLFERDAPDEVIVERVDVARDTIAEDRHDLRDRIDQVVQEMEVRRDRRGMEKPVEERPPPDKPEEVPVVPSDGRDGSSTSTSSSTTTVADSVSDSRPAKDRRSDG